MGFVQAITWLKAGLLIISQIVAGIAAAAVVSGLFPGALTVRTSLGSDTSIVQGLFIEMFLTFELIFCIFMLAAEKHRATFLAPIGIGLSLFIAELAGGGDPETYIACADKVRCSLHRRIAQPSSFLWP